MLKYHLNRSSTQNYMDKGAKMDQIRQFRRILSCLKSKSTDTAKNPSKLSNLIHFSIYYHVILSARPIEMVFEHVKSMEDAQISLIS